MAGQIFHASKGIENPEAVRGVSLKLYDDLKYIKYI